ncbi:acyltransferase domain-containing protein [Roseibium sp.]|uniref:acyltransferase domain-containing protein n=1 Tax=Roseibium sp. TaxID=1936156 RepID=UPI003A97D26C
MLSLSPSLPTVFCFAGQGSQYYHMAADLMQAHPVFKRWMDIGDRIIRDTQGFSPLEKIYAADCKASDPFDHLEHSHPALFMTQFATAKLVQHLGIKPDMLLGVSLGEFVAMSVAGMVPFETALKAIASQPAIFRKSAPAGCLIAVLASEDICKTSPVLTSSTEVAGVTARAHCVLACLANDKVEVLAELRRLDVAFQVLPVPFAFHSTWIENAKEDYLRAARGLSFETPFWPVWSACSGQKVEDLDTVAAWQIVRNPMQLRQAFSRIEADGGAHYVDLSPTGSLAAIQRQELDKTSASTVTNLMSPFGGNLQRLAEFCEASPA